MNELHTEQILEGFTRVLKSFGKNLIELGKSIPIDTIMFDQGFESLQEKIDRQMPIYILQKYLMEERPIQEESKTGRAGKIENSVRDSIENSLRNRKFNQ